MFRSPYRIAAPPPADEEQSPAPCPDLDLIPVFGVLWAVSVFRVFAALMVGDTFGSEPTLALVMVFVLPLLSARAIAWLWLQSPLSARIRTSSCGASRPK